jgi:hypothetical protein
MIDPGPDAQKKNIKKIINPGRIIMHRQLFFISIFFCTPGIYGTGREPAPAPSTGGVLQA